MHEMTDTGSRTMADLVAVAAARHGGKPALRHKVGEGWVDVSYAELERTVAEVALGLVDLGIEPGDRVSILSHTRPEWTYACFATFAVGAVAVSIYQTNSAEECQYVLGHSGSRAVFVEDAEQLAKIRAVEGELPALEFVIVMEPADVDGGAVSLAGAARAGATARGRRARAAPRRDQSGGRLLVHLHVGYDRAAQGVRAHARQLPRGHVGGPGARRGSRGRSRLPVLAVGARAGAGHPVRGARPRRHAGLLGEGSAEDRGQPDGASADVLSVGAADLREDPHAGHDHRRPRAARAGNARRIGGAPRARAGRAGVRAAAGGVRRAPSRPCMSTCATCSAGACARR